MVQEQWRFGLLIVQNILDYCRSAILRFITNHDEYAWDNTPSALFGGEKAAFSAFALTSLWSPVVLIYNIRTWLAYQNSIFTKSPLNWSFNTNYRTQYEQFMMVRKNNPALYKGT